MSDSPDETLALARAAAEAVRALNHATLGGGLGQPSDAYAVLGELSLTASRIPQLLGQVGRWLAAALAAGRLISDARAGAASLARDLEQAQQQLAAVNGQPSQKEERS